MVLPSAVIHVVAAIDLISTTVLSLQLDPIPVVHKPHPSDSSLFKSLHQKVKAGPLSTSASRPSAHRLLLFVYLVCVARCLTLFIVGFGVSKSQRRNHAPSTSATTNGQTEPSSSSGGGGGAIRSQTQSGPLSVAGVCFFSFAANTFVLNLLFQARPAHVAFIGTGLTISGLVGGQVVLSLLEWVLFVLVVGADRNGNVSGASSSGSVVDAPSQDQPTVDGAYEINDANLVTDVRQTSKSGASTSAAQNIINDATQASSDLKGKAQEGTKQTDYGTFGTTNPVTGTSTSIALAQNDKAATVEPTSLAAVSTTTAKSSSDFQASKASTSVNQSSAEPTLVGADERAKAKAQADTESSQDIVDIPEDRDASKLEARQRLDNARQKGKVKRSAMTSRDGPSFSCCYLYRLRACGCLLTVYHCYHHLPLLLLLSVIPCCRYEV
ncbi:hypothetical protein FA10DRAFT_122159 [Acaromyces ingoldii]|uniref:Uncharacterized protein n=1 Tax=Acaromyces ingoldii TaxID=215250 RepID=A0A316YND1_9BASI|nr:hypothetical protein FA10DRAFT_122159 [Acaromyces ingoldii]PWN90721.1 hypothetical protein FA10DRAFT_122159 [Acaromyces ingoldii]